MKILECCKCHRLFRSTNDHITIYFGNGQSDNFCTSCTDMMLGYLNIGMQIEEATRGAVGGIILKKKKNRTLEEFEGRGQEGDVYDD